jgi:hypothetical protein
MLYACAVVEDRAGMSVRVPAAGTGLDVALAVDGGVAAGDAGRGWLWSLMMNTAAAGPSPTTRLRAGQPGTVQR